jgi:hypothetical protein
MKIIYDSVGSVKKTTKKQSHQINDFMVAIASLNNLLLLVPFSNRYKNIDLSQN